MPQQQEQRSEILSLQHHLSNLIFQATMDNLHRKKIAIKWVKN